MGELHKCPKCQGEIVIFPVIYFRTEKRETVDSEGWKEEWEKWIEEDVKPLLVSISQTLGFEPNNKPNDCPHCDAKLIYTRKAVVDSIREV